MRIHTVGELRRRAKEVKHDLPDLSVLGSHIETGLHGCVFKYGDDKVLKIGRAVDKVRMQNMLSWLQKDHKHVAKLISFGDLGTNYWTLIEFIPRTLSSQDRVTLSKVRDIARRNKGWFGRVVLAIEGHRLTPEWSSFLKFLHRAKYWHGDLHSGNVRKTNDGTIKLIDFESFGW